MSGVSFGFSSLISFKLIVRPFFERDTFPAEEILGSPALRVEMLTPEVFPAVKEALETEIARRASAAAAAKAEANAKAAEAAAAAKKEAEKGARLESFRTAKVFSAANETDRGLLEIAPQCQSIPDLYSRYCREAGPVGWPSLLAALSTAVARGWLRWSDEPVVNVHDTATR